mmetsp:Transcript_19519/g.39515  ORF Transcript_19519/g.39515 Transcript_19519/m.39515 type:complete len:231 (+) Transcript_19519:87-779(+)
MGAIFGRKKRKREEKAKPKMTDKDKAILDLKRQKIKMKNYKTRINATLEKEMAMAKQLIKQKKKKKALLVLKKKKYLETLVERTDKAILNTEKLVDSIEYASMQKQIFDAMKAGNDCLKEIQSEISIEEVEKLMEDTEEAIAYQEQISETLAGSLTNDDELAVDEELAQLEKEDAEFKALELEEQLPDVPDQQLEPEEKQPAEPVVEEKTAKKPKIAATTEKKKAAVVLA